eukprot:7507226-Lingulodinium_polyedra.AAC.1
MAAPDAAGAEATEAAPPLRTDRPSGCPWAPSATEDPSSLAHTPERAVIALPRMRSAPLGRREAASFLAAVLS